MDMRKHYGVQCPKEMEPNGCMFSFICFLRWCLDYICIFLSVFLSRAKTNKHFIQPTQVTSKPFMDWNRKQHTTTSIFMFSKPVHTLCKYSEKTSVYMFACGASQLNLGSWELKRDICAWRKHNSDCYQDKQPTVSTAPLSHQQPAAK